MNGNDAAQRQYGEVALTFLRDLKLGSRSLWRAKGLTITVVLTLALGIGANAAIFTLVRGVLLRPLVNRGEDRLVYVRQSARGMGAESLPFSVPEIQDLRTRVKTISAFGEFSTIGFTMVGLAMDEEGRQVVAPWIEKKRFDVNGMQVPANYPILLGNDKVADQFGGLIGLPTSLLISRDGKILKRFIGLVGHDIYIKAIEDNL